MIDIQTWIKTAVDLDPGNRDPLPQVCEDRWLVRSALQKAIRRGQAHSAFDYAVRLYDYDPANALRALCVIALEDVGLANPDSVYYTLALAKNKRLLSFIGVKKALWSCVYHLSTGMKSRGCCELSLAVDLQFSTYLDYLVSQDLTPLKIFDLREDLFYAALCFYRGKAPRGMSGVRKDPNAVGLITEEFKARYPTIGLLMGDAYNLAYDTLFLAMAPVYQLMSAQYPDGGIVGVGTTFPPTMMVKGVAAEAYDMHTRSGKIAISAFYTSLSKRGGLLSKLPKSTAVSLLGAAVFLEEGGLISNKVPLPDLTTIQDKVYLLSLGCSVDNMEELRELVRGNLDVLHSKRVWAATL